MLLMNMFGIRGQHECKKKKKNRESKRDQMISSDHAFQSQLACVGLTMGKYNSPQPNRLFFIDAWKLDRLIQFIVTLTPFPSTSRIIATLIMEDLFLSITCQILS